MGAGSGNRRPTGNKYWPARSRSMITTAVIAPKEASNTAHPIAAKPSPKRKPGGTPHVATTGLTITLMTTSATDRNASIHITARSVRS